METMTINGEEWVKKANVTNIQYPAVNTNGMKYVICRGYYCGVHAGFLKEHNGNHVVLLHDRRLWSWKANQGISLSALAIHGLAPDVKLPDELPENWLGDVYEVMPCTEQAANSIRNAGIRDQQ